MSRRKGANVSGFDALGPSFNGRGLAATGPESGRCLFGPAAKLCSVRSSFLQGGAGNWPVPLGHLPSGTGLNARGKQPRNDRSDAPWRAGRREPTGTGKLSALPCKKLSCANLKI